MYKLKRIILEYFICLPGLGRFKCHFYKRLGVNFEGKVKELDFKVISKYENIYLGKNVEIRHGSVLTAYDKIKIGKNSAIAYQVLILTSATPGGPHNSLFKIYGRIKKPVTIGQNCWIGAKSIIFPGVKIGDYCVVAAGSVVTKNIPDFSVVGGVPAKILKKLNPEDLIKTQ